MPAQRVKWSKLDPKDFYFCVLIDQEFSKIKTYFDRNFSEVYVYIVPISFWDEYHFMDDSKLDITCHLPDYMEEDMEGIYCSSESLEETNKELLSRGFLMNKEFSKYCSELIFK